MVLILYTHRLSRSGQGPGARFDRKLALRMTRGRDEDHAVHSEHNLKRGILVDGQRKSSAAV
eukprot:766901-Rhodomonas_salina.4